MDKTGLKQVLEAHLKWLRNEDGGKRADLTYADLTGANLAYADLTYADLAGANLAYADLTYADLAHADLTYAVLKDADLTGANLAYADLTGANLTGAVLTYAVLKDADLTGANLAYADLIGANLTGAKIYFPISCPSEGAFVGWKKAENQDNGTSCIVKLMIYDDARRSSATGRKCRCDKAKVLAVYDIYGDEITANVSSKRDKSFRYVVGETITVPGFDENRWNECSTGIHFFITREEAERYNG